MANETFELLFKVIALGMVIGIFGILARSIKLIGLSVYLMLGSYVIMLLGAFFT